MRILIIYTLFIIPFSYFFSQEEKKILVEVFTNSHCPLCPPAHDIISDYSTGTNGDKIIFIYYHMVYPYPDDLLYHHNTVDSDGRDEYYDPVPATPRGFFDGEIQGSYSMWKSTLDNLIQADAPLNINLGGSKMNNSVKISAGIRRTGEIPDNDLVIHFVVAEDVNYEGRNGIVNHKNVMRDMIDDDSGLALSLDLNETVEVEKEIQFHNEWIKDSLKIIVFIQSSGSKKVYQSEIIEYDKLDDATRMNEENLPEEFILEQNFPNPFNPSTKIVYHIPEPGFVTLKIFNITGREITSLVNQNQSAGVYEINYLPMPFFLQEFIFTS